MERELFSPMALDAMGELMNISLGSSATAVSNMLDHRVDITTPTVSVIASKDFVLGNLEPAIGVEIQYVEGLEGSNIMVLRRRDIKIIVDILMGTETPDEEFELNDLTISCVCEVMNQMMGASATAMSDFLGYPVNISTPTTFELDNLEDFKAKQGEDLVLARFFLRIEGKMESEFMNVMPVSLACKLLAGMGLEDEIFVKDGDEAAAPASAPEPAPAESSNKQLSQEEIEKMMAGMGGDSAPAPAPEPAPSGGKLSQEEIEKMMAGMGGAPAPTPEPAPSGGKLSQEEIEKMMAGMGGAPAPAPQPAPNPPAAGTAPVAGAPGTPPQMPPYPMPGMEGAPFANGYMGYPPMYYPYPPYPPQPQEAPQPPEPKVINTKPMPMQEMDVAEKLGKEQAQNLDLIMEVPLQVTVEIGRTRRKVQDILGFSTGSLVVLDKLAGDQVDLFVNGKCIARGDVVVIDDNFGVRITEIVQKPGVETLVKK